MQFFNCISIPILSLVVHLFSTESFFHWLENPDFYLVDIKRSADSNHLVIIPLFLLVDGASHQDRLVVDYLWIYLAI